LERLSVAPVVAYEEDVRKAVPVQVYNGVPVGVGEGASGIRERGLHPAFSASDRTAEAGRDTHSSKSGESETEALYTFCHSCRLEDVGEIPSRSIFMSPSTSTGIGWGIEEGGSLMAF
jgi:hypothetical protein